MSRKFLLLLLFVPAVAGLIWAAADSRSESGSVLTIQTMDGSVHHFNIEKAVTYEQMKTGLMNRTELADDAGMLFLFSNVKPRSFWMKDTLIPLDIIFIKEDRKILHIHPMALPLDETGILSQGPAAAVLEINGGKAAALGIGVGDLVSW